MVMVVVMMSIHLPVRTNTTAVTLKPFMLIRISREDSSTKMLAKNCLELKIVQDSLEISEWVEANSHEQCGVFSEARSKLFFRVQSFTGFGHKLRKTFIEQHLNQCLKP